jgi:hypothetical protein
MKKHFQISILIVLCLLNFESAFSQDKYGETPELCKEKLSEFYEFARYKDYTYSYEPWLWSFENCPASSKNIYKYGLKIVEDRYEKATGAQKDIESQLIDKIFIQRIKYFPDNLGKVYSDWAISLEKRNATKEQIFEKLELAFKMGPAQMSIKNLATYFQEVTDRNKDTNPQKVFDTYDDALEAVNEKIDLHSKSKDILDKKVASGETLSKVEATKLKNDGINLRGLGQVEGLLDNKVDVIATCERLVPLYEKGFEAHKNDAKWLRRAASRLNAKECTNVAIFAKLVETYAAAEPSPEAYILVSIIFDKKGQKAKANEYRKKAVDLETDPYKKADYLYKIGSTYRKSSPSTAVSYAKKALIQRPSMGKAYLLIASAYAASANSCGTDEISKRMVYVAAANKARLASKVDPSLTSRAKKYVNSYMASAPNKKLIFGSDYTSGESFKISCWINETVKVP